MEISSRKKIYKQKFKTGSSSYLCQLTFLIGNRVKMMKSLHYLVLYLKPSEKTRISFTRAAQNIQLKIRRNRMSEGKLGGTSWIRLRSIVNNKSKDFSLQEISRILHNRVLELTLLMLLHRSTMTNHKVSCKKSSSFWENLPATKWFYHRKKLIQRLASLMAAQLKLK